MNRRIGASLAIVACLLAVVADRQRDIAADQAWRSCQARVIQTLHYNIDNPLIPLPIEACGPPPKG